MIVISTKTTKFLSTDNLLVPVKVKNLTTESVVDIKLTLPTGEQTKFSWNCSPNSEITKTISLDAGLGRYTLLTNYSSLELDVVQEYNIPTLSSTVINDIATLSSSGIHSNSQWMLYIIPLKGIPEVKAWVSPTKLNLIDYGDVTVSLFNPLEKSSTNIIKLAPVTKPKVVKEDLVSVEVIFDSSYAEYGSIHWVTLKLSNPLDVPVNVWFSPKFPSWMIPLFPVLLDNEPIKAKGFREFKCGIKVVTDAYKVSEETVQLSPMDGYAVHDTTIVPLQCKLTKLKVQPKLRDAMLSIEKLWFSSSSVFIGDIVTLNLTVVNTGEIPIEEVKLDYVTLPSQLGNYKVGFSGIPLAPGESYTYKAPMLALASGTVVYTITENSLQFESNGDMITLDVTPSTSVTVG